MELCEMVTAPLAIYTDSAVLQPITDAEAQSEDKRRLAFVRLPGGETVTLAPQMSAPFGIYAERCWQERLAQLRDLFGRYHTARVLWLVDQVAEELRRTQRRGLPYRTVLEARHPVRMPRVNADLPERRPPVPALQCDHIVLSLVPTPDGPGTVIIQNRHYGIGSGWWQTRDAYSRAYSRAVAACQHQAIERIRAAYRDGLAEASGPLAEFERQSAGKDTLVLMETEGFVMTWHQPDLFALRTRYGPWAAQDRNGSIYRFSGGWLILEGDAGLWSGFIDNRANAPRVLVDPDRPEWRPVFVSSGPGRGRFCGASYEASIVNSSLCHAGVLLQLLSRADIILRAGGGQVAHSPFRQLENSGAPVISAREARQFGLQVYHHDHLQRGREPVRPRPRAAAVS